MMETIPDEVPDTYIQDKACGWGAKERVPGTARINTTFCSANSNTYRYYTCNKQPSLANMVATATDDFNFKTTSTKIMPVPDIRNNAIYKCAETKPTSGIYFLRNGWTRSFYVDWTMNRSTITIYRTCSNKTKPPHGLNICRSTKCPKTRAISTNCSHGYDNLPCATKNFSCWYCGGANLRTWTLASKRVSTSARLRPRVGITNTTRSSATTKEPLWYMFRPAIPITNHVPSGKEGLDSTAYGVALTFRTRVCTMARQ